LRVVPVLREDDGCCWIEDGTLFLNLRWASPRDVVEYIDRCVIHEVVEHVLGEGHRVAEAAEKLVFEFSSSAPRRRALPS